MLSVQEQSPTPAPLPVLPVVKMDEKHSVSFLISQLHPGISPEQIQKISAEHGVNETVTRAIFEIVKHVSLNLRAEVSKEIIKKTLIDRGIEIGLVNVIIDRLCSTPMVRLSDKKSPVQELNMRTRITKIILTEVGHDQSHEDIEKIFAKHGIGDHVAKGFFKIYDIARTELYAGTAIAPIKENLINLRVDNSLVETLVDKLSGVLNMESSPFAVALNLIKSETPRIGPNDLTEQLIARGIEERLIRRIYYLLPIVDKFIIRGFSCEAIYQELKNIGVASQLANFLVSTLYTNRFGKPICHLSNITLHDWRRGSRLFVGSYCSVANNVQIFSGGNHRTDFVSTFTFSAEVVGITKGHVVIGNDVWLGKGCTIMSGVTIGDGAVVSANAHVVKDVGPYEIVGGNPARLIRRRFSDEQITALLELKWWNLPDKQVDTLVPYLCSDDIDLAIYKIREARAALRA